MSKRRVYTDEFRASACLMLEAAGWPERKGAVSKVANHLGVAHQTLGRWARGVSNPPPNKIVQSKKRDMLGELESLQYLLLGEMAEAYKDAPFNHLATAFGIITDKHRLLSGESTDNNAVQIKITYAND